MKLFCMVLGVIAILVAVHSFDAQVTVQAAPFASGWVDLSSHIVSAHGTPNLSSVVFIGQEGWIGSGNQTEIYHTTDGGATFEVQAFPTTEIHLAMRSTLEGYAGGQNGRIYHTTNGGANWDSLGTTGNPVRSISCPRSGATCYAVGDNGSATLITGTVISKSTTGLYGNLRSVHFPIDSNEGWLCGSGIIRHFADSAWQADQTYANNGYNAIAFVDTLNGWAVGDDGVIAHTTTGGEMDGTPLSGWYGQTNPDPNSPQRTLNGIYALNVNEAWAVSDFGVILHTTNGGQTWAVEANGMTSSLLTGVHAEDSNTVYVVGNSGAFLKYTNATPGLDKYIYLPLILRNAP